MAYTAKPFYYRLLRKLLHPAIEAEATAVEIVHPAQIRYAPAAFSLPDDPERVIACEAQTDRETERRRTAEGEHEHGATIIYSHADVTIIDGSAYFKKSLLEVRSTGRRIVRVRSSETIDRALLCSNFVIDRYFGHWLTDGLPLELIAGDRAVEPVTLQKPPWSHEAAYRSLSGCQDHPVDAARISRLEVVDDRGLNDHRIDRIERVRSAITARVPVSDAPRRPVFIRRGGAHLGRTMTNEAALVEELERRGFDIVAPETMAAEAVVAALRDASVIVAVEGSAQGHAVMAATTGTPFVTIMPPRRFNSVFKPICDAIRSPWGYTVAEDRGADRFEQPVDRLLKLVDRVL